MQFWCTGLIYRTHQVSQRLPLARPQGGSSSASLGIGPPLGTRAGSEGCCLVPLLGPRCRFVPSTATGAEGPWLGVLKKTLQAPAYRCPLLGGSLQQSAGPADLSAACAKKNVALTMRKGLQPTWMRKSEGWACKCSAPLCVSSQVHCLALGLCKKKPVKEIQAAVFRLPLEEGLLLFLCCFSMPFAWHFATGLCR